MQQVGTHPQPQFGEQAFNAARRSVGMRGLLWPAATVGGQHVGDVGLAI